MSIWLYRWLPRRAHQLVAFVVIAEGVLAMRWAVRGGPPSAVGVGLALAGAGLFAIYASDSFARMGSLWMQAVCAGVLTLGLSLATMHTIAFVDLPHLGSKVDSLVTWGAFTWSVQTGDDALAEGLLTNATSEAMFGEGSRDVSRSLRKMLGPQWWAFRRIFASEQQIVLARGDGTGVVLSNEPQGWRIARIVYERTERRTETYSVQPTVRTTRYLPRGQRVWVVRPQDGLRDATYRVKYGNGAETGRELVARSVRATASPGVCWVGTSARADMRAQGLRIRDKRGMPISEAQSTATVFPAWSASGVSRGTVRVVSLGATEARVLGAWPNRSGSWRLRWSGPHALGTQVFVLVQGGRPAAWRAITFR